MNEQPNPSRRNLLKGLSLLPAVAVAGSGGAAHAVEPPAAEYRPTWFNADEWAFVIAISDRLIPHDEHGPGAVELGVPEFLDRHMQTPYAAGDIWYMQGPFLEAPPQFGYQGRLPLRDLIRVGIQAVDRHCNQAFQKSFARMEPAQQDQLLLAMEKGDLKLEDVGSKLFFGLVLNEVRYGYFADPKHGGNKNMGSWKMIGYPGMRADYLEWVGVRDRAYPIGPVDLAGRRG